MKNHNQSRKQKEMGPVPRYKSVVPAFLCTYMLFAQFVSGLGNKTLMLTLTAIGMVVWFVGERIFPDYVYKGEKRAHNRCVVIMLGIFLLMAVLSEIFADDYASSLFTSETDSLVALFGYVTLFFMTYHYMKLEKSQQIFKLAVVVISIVIAIMSMMEFFDCSIAAAWVGSIEDLEARNRVVLTFGNSNYYGIFCCMLIPFIMEMWLNEKQIRKKVVLMLVHALLVCCVLMSKSTTVLYLMLMLTAGILLYEYKKLWKQICLGIGWIAIMAVAIGIVNVASSGKLLELAAVSVSNADAFVEEEYRLYEVEDIQLEGKRLVIEGVDSSFIVEYNQVLTFYNEKNQILDIENTDNRITFTEAPYDCINVSLSYQQAVDMLYLEIDAGYKDTIDFYIDDGEFRGVAADGTAIEDIEGVVGREEWYSLFTGRGYIWANTIEMLDEVLFIGKGCSNFVHNFKQYDYVGLLKTQGTHQVIIDRPHSMFLQYCVDIGIVGTIALFAFVAYILVGWIYQMVKNERQENILSIASFFSIVSFMIFAIFNDSIISVSPYLWIFLGINLTFQTKNHQ